MHITVPLLALLFSLTVPARAAEPTSLVDLLSRVRRFRPRHRTRRSGLPLKRGSRAQAR